MALGKWAAGSETAAEEQNCLVKGFVRFCLVSQQLECIRQGET